MKTFNVMVALALVLCCIELHAQGDQAKAERKRKEAEQLFDHFDYPGAVKLYEEVALVQDDQFIHLRIATCYRKIGNLRAAEDWYRKAAVETLPLEEQYNYAEVLMSNTKYEEAREWYIEYANNAPLDVRAKRKLAAIANITDLQKNKDQYEIQKVGINSPYSDFGATFYENGVVFSSSREEVSPGKRYKHTNSAFLDLFISRYDQDTILGAPEKFSKEINSRYHEGPATIYDNGNRMIFTRNDFKNKAGDNKGSTIRLQLFESKKTSDGAWSKPEQLNLADKNSSVGHPSVSMDGDRLYFSSDMPGGFGGTDLYASQYANGNWSPPENLGDKVNTRGNEMFPFISQEGALYFASDGHGGLGGLDIYKTSLDTPEPVGNLGAPVNSGKDDFAFVVHQSGDWGYFSSNRSGGEGDDDLYRFVKKTLDTPQETVPEDTIHFVREEPEYIYTVQILALLNPKTVHRSFLQDLKGVLKHDGKDGFHRYTFGEYTGVDSALEMLEVIRDKGYSDAFIRKVKRYSELSTSPGRDVEETYVTETKSPVF